MVQDLIGVLRPDEKITLELRALYEQYGFRKYRMGKFEEYELYLENKNFLKSKNIITFHDLDGRVLALKPDVTLSIAKNTHANASSSEKFYYLENVYRLDKQSGGYREISQLGLEYIGKLDEVAAYEVICLAQKTLESINKSHWMQLSHIGFLLSLLDALGINGMLRQEIMENVRGKKLHELKESVARAGIAPAAAQLLMNAARLCGEFTETLKKAREIAISQSMTDALDELERVYDLLAISGQEKALMLDFSLVNDSDYYGGLIFQGFVENIPRALLAGGYYGNLLKKFGRDLDAIGFAVYLNELNQLFRTKRQSDADALILYDDATDKTKLIKKANQLMLDGMRIRLEKTIPDDMICGKIYSFYANEWKEAGTDA
ncbi:MAG: ATP phosphoribosyltransferase regulatory subunit [Clostridiales bacterium]|nr:ATP phosphoribosyltransferase regulatory subunit [Clostridiales bacterium]